MLLGLYTNILETHNRLVLPGEFQTAFKDGLYLTQGFDHNLMLLTLQAFEAVYQKITALNLADPLARLLLRLILASAQRVALSEDGTLSIPAALKDLAALQAEVVLVGQGDYAELWSAEAWRAQAQQLLQVEAGRFAALNISTR